MAGEIIHVLVPDCMISFADAMYKQIIQFDEYCPAS